MNKSDFYYDLPQELIAQTPIYPRDNSRMLVYDRLTNKIAHKHFYDIVEYLKEGDVLVINNTKVIPARIFCHREGKDEVIEVLLLKRIDYNHYECITKPAKKLKIDTKVIFSEKLSAIVKEIGEQGIRVLEFTFDGVLEDILNDIGTMPLPPYIKEKLQDQSIKLFIAKSLALVQHLLRDCILHRNYLRKLREKAFKLHKCFCMSVWELSDL